MQNARSRLVAGLAGAFLCLFAVTSYGQTPTTTPGSPDASAQTAQPTTPATPAPSGTTVDPIVPGPTTDIVAGTETTTETWSYPGGIWGILATALVALLILFAVFRRRDTTVVNETYVAPGTRNAGMGTAVGDRTLSPRAASGTDPGTRAGFNDPNVRGGINDPNPRGGINDPPTRG